MSNPRPSRLALPVAAVAASAALCGFFAAPNARATGFLTDQFGADHGQPALGNAYSVYFNPAAMTGMKGSDVTLEGVFAARSLSFNRSPSALSPSCGPSPSSPSCAGTGSASSPIYQSSNTGPATLFNGLAAPYLGYVTDFGGSKFRLGVAGYVPFGGQVSWGKVGAFQNYPGAPGAYDGPQRWASISASTASLYGTVALAYRIEAAHLGIGVSASVINTSIQDTRAHNFDGSDSVIGNGSIVEGRSYLDVSGVQVGAAAGLYWEPTTTLRLGASYTSQPNFGTMRLSGSFKDYTPGSDVKPTNVDLLQSLPDVIRFGAAWRVAPDAELRLDGSWQRWSEFTNQCVVISGKSCSLGNNGSSPNGDVVQNVVRNFQDAFKIRAGGAYWVLPQTEMFASGSLETSPVGSRYEDALIYDNVHVAGTLGVRHGFTKNIYAMAAYTYIYVLPMTVTDSALATYAQPSKAPSENGQYSASLYILNAALSYVF